jgi:hypothetical protein
MKAGYISTLQVAYAMIAQRSIYEQLHRTSVF